MVDNLGLLCPKCSSVRLETTDTRPVCEAVKRRRKCKACGHKFNTFEFLEEDMPLTTKNSNAIKIEHLLSLIQRLTTVVKEIGKE